MRGECDDGSSPGTQSAAQCAQPAPRRAAGRGGRRIDRVEQRRRSPTVASKERRCGARFGSRLRVVPGERAARAARPGSAGLPTSQAPTPRRYPSAALSGRTRAGRRAALRSPVTASFRACRQAPNAQPKQASSLQVMPGGRCGAREREPVVGFVVVVACADAEIRRRTFTARIAGKLRMRSRRLCGRIARTSGEQHRAGSCRRPSPCRCAAPGSALPGGRRGATVAPWPATGRCMRPGTDWAAPA